MSPDVRQRIVNNLVWLLASLVLALLVWFIAEIELVESKQFFGVPIDFQYDEDRITITNDPRSSVLVIVRAQQSVLELLTEDDITVQADLRNLESGTHTVPLTVQAARPASADTQPAQITVELEQLVAQQKPVQIDITSPAANYSYERESMSIAQAEVRGAADIVANVAAVEASMDLSNVQSAVERTVSLEAVDADGNRVTNVSITPRTVTVSIDVFQRDDVLRASVRPQIQFETLADNYQFDGIRYDPQEVFLAGPPEALDRLNGTIDTEQISLEGQTDDFQLTVPLDLPSNVRDLSGDTNGTVMVEIFLSAQTTSIQLDDIPVNIVPSVPGGFTVNLNPDTISVVLNGPVAELEMITANDVDAFVDISGLSPGTYDLEPRIDIAGISLSNYNTTLLPPTVTVGIVSPTPEATPELTPEVTPEANRETVPESD